MKRTRLGTALGLAIVAASMPASAASTPEKSGLVALDANGDHAIRRQEAANAQINVFHRMDSNHDNILSRDEFNASQPQPDQGAEPDKSVKHARARALDQRFNNLDADSSGDISLTEYQSAMTPYFDRLDANGDGVIDGGELKRGYMKNNSAGSQADKDAAHIND